MYSIAVGLLTTKNFELFVFLHQSAKSEDCFFYDHRLVQPAVAVGPMLLPVSLASFASVQLMMEVVMTLEKLHDFWPTLLGPDCPTIVQISIFYNHKGLVCLKSMFFSTLQADVCTVFIAPINEQSLNSKSLSHLCPASKTKFLVCTAAAACGWSQVTVPLIKM